MIKSISYWCFKDGLANEHPVEAALQEAASAGFEGVELCISTEGEISVTSSQSDCEEIRHKIDASGLVVETLASGMSWAFNPTSNDAGVREKAVELHERALERAAWLGCDALLFVPGVVNSPIAPDEHIRPDHALARCRENVVRLLETADRVGVDLCLENVWNGMFYSATEFRQFLDDINHPRLGAYLDLGNLVGVDQYPPHWIEILGHRIKRVHIKDFKHQFDWAGSYDFCDLLEGDVPFAASLQTLEDIGYDSTIVAEMLPWKPGRVEKTSMAMDRLLRRERVSS